MYDVIVKAVKIMFDINTYVQSLAKLSESPKIV